MKKQLPLLAVFALCSATYSQAASVTISSAPTVDDADIAQTTFNFHGGNVGPNDQNPGQGFTTLNTSPQYSLTSFSFMLNGNQSVSTTRSYTIRLIDLTTPSATTTIATETANNVSGTWGAGQYINFTLDTPLTLDSETTYGFDFEITAADGNFSASNHRLRKSPSDAYTGGPRYNRADGDPTSVSTFGDDYVFHANLTAVPEPSAFALLAGMFGLTWVMLRRR